jgi:hypothetical protein
MGFADFLVPYAGSMNLLIFELILFGLSLLCLFVALGFTKAERKNATTTSSLLNPKGGTKLKNLIQTNFKRALSFGAIYIILGIAISFLTGGLITGLVNETASASPDVPLFVSQIFPLMFPIYTVMGSFGGLMVFVSDRTKGVYEYLIAYGVNVYEIFWSTMLATLGLVTVVIGVSLTGNIAILLLMGGTIQPALIELLLVYTIPISYASVAFMTMAGMMWSSLTRKVPGVNSPIGIATLLGMAPILTVLIFSSLFTGSGSFLLLVGAVTLILVALVAIMMVVANKKMNRERLLSDA